MFNPRQILREIGKLNFQALGAFSYTHCLIAYVSYAVPVVPTDETASGTCVDIKGESPLRRADCKSAVRVCTSKPAIGSLPLPGPNPYPLQWSIIRSNHSPLNPSVLRVAGGRNAVKIQDL